MTWRYNASINEIKNLVNIRFSAEFPVSNGQEIFSNCLFYFLGLKQKRNGCNGSYYYYYFVIRFCIFFADMVNISVFFYVSLCVLASDL